MTSLIKSLSLSVLLPAALGFLAVLPIINSENGYVAGFIFLPLFLLILIASVGLFIAGLIATGVKGRPGLFVLLASFMLFGSFMTTAMTAKYFEIGSYHEQPMIHYPAPVSNVVLFKPGTTNQQINQFLDQTISTPQPDGGTWPLPGIQELGQLASHDGSEVVSFSFFETATEEQRQDVYSRVRSSPFVFELKENVAIKDYMPDPSPPPESQSTDVKKAVVIESRTP